jgi:hypothetical protein
VQAPTHWRPVGVPDLLPLGHPELLVGSVRDRLVWLREQALRAQESSAA